MKYCTQCGAMLEDNHRFCIKCGAKQEILQSAPQQNYTQQQNYAQQQNYTQQQNYAQQQDYTQQQVYSQPMGQPSYGQPMDPVQLQYQLTGIDFSRVKARFRCVNGHVFDGNDQTCICPKCQVPLQKDGYIQLYRKGNMVGCAVGMGIYINNVPYGYIGNKESIKIYLPFDRYMLHVTHTTTRTCNDPIIMLSPQCPVVYTKAHFSSAGFKITIEEASPSDMPIK